MSDDYAKSLKASKLRTEALETERAALEEKDDEQAAELSALAADVDALAARAGVALPDGEVGDEAGQIAQAQRAELTVEERFVETDRAFTAGLEEDRVYLIERGEEAVSWDELLDRESQHQIREHLARPLQAEPLTRADWVTLGVAVGFGVTAVLLDDLIDNKVKQATGHPRYSSKSPTGVWDPRSKVGQSEFGKTIRSFDVHGKNLAIDYDRQGIGGAQGVHRARSAGHDILRPFSAMKQIRTGQFTGHTWENNVRRPVEAMVRDAGGTPFKSVDQMLGQNGALMLWSKHLASDFSTPQSLPIPGWTFLHSVPNHTIRSWGAESYKAGLNLRRLITTGVLSVAAVELVIRSSIYGRTFFETKRETGKGSCQLTPERRWKLDDLLLAGHGIVAAASAGKVGIRWQTDGPVALRHLNIPTLMATSRYALPVMIRYATRNSPERVYERNERELFANWEAVLAENAGGAAGDFVTEEVSGLAL